MTYQEYQQSIILNEESMSETRRKQHEEIKFLEEECIATNQKLFDDYVDKKRANNQKYQEAIQDVRSRWKQERMRLHLEHAKVVEQWREEHGINCPPPFVSLPSGERPEQDINKGE